MNDQIKKLELQAIQAILNGADPDLDIDRMYIPQVFSRLFAELIVRECALQCQHNNDMDRILEHFGVKE